MDENVTLRRFRWDDLPALVPVINRSLEADNDEQRFTLEQLENAFHTPNSDPENECFVAVMAAGQIVGLSMVRLNVESGIGYSAGDVDPEYRRQGIGSRLIRATDMQVCGRLDDVPADKPVIVQRVARDTLVGRIALYEAEGYRAVRAFYHMRRTLAEPLQPAALPDGITLRPFDKERDARAVYEADNEAFEDHWGHTPMPYDNWAHFFLDPSRFDPDLFLVAYDGDEIAGVCLCRAYGAEQPQLGWVNDLGVRKPWRKRGLGRALLLEAFYRFQQRGWTEAGLGVDAENTNNAVRLYEGVGMQVHRRSVAYRKALRGSPEDIFRG